MGSLPDLSKLRDVAQGKRVGEAEPVHPDLTQIERVIVVLKEDGEVTRQDVELAAAFARAACEQAAKTPVNAPSNDLG